jgi:hypothetical protein
MDVKEFGGLTDLFAELRGNLRSSTNLRKLDCFMRRGCIVQSPSFQDSWNVGLFNDYNVFRNAG